MDCCVSLVNGSETVANFFLWLWNRSDFFLEIALIFFEIALGNSGTALIWMYEGDIGELLEILGICLKLDNSRPKRMTCSRMPSQETHSARVRQGCLGPEVYITCVCCPHSGPVMLVCTSAWTCWKWQRLARICPPLYCEIWALKSIATDLLLFYSTVLASKVPPIETKTLN